MTEVVAVLIGALVALVAQWFIAPIVERRVRARERWELEVLKAGELISQDLERARWDASNAFDRWDIECEVASDDDELYLSDEEIAERDQRLAEALQTAKPATEVMHDLVIVRLRWVMGRILVRLPDDHQLNRIWRDYLPNALAVSSTVMWKPKDHAQVGAWWQAEEKYRDELLAAIEELADGVVK
jgi:hypothetical protein